MLTRSIKMLSTTKIKLAYIIIIGTIVSSCSTTSSSKDDNASVPPDAQKYYATAVRAMKSGNTNQAFQLFNAIHKKYPDFAGPQLNIGLMYLKKNKLIKAEQAFKKAISINGNNAVAYNLLGVTYRRNGKFNKAKEAYLQAITKNDKYANAHLNLGVLYDIYMDDLKRAVHHYEQYQKYSQTADKKVANWIIDLKRRTKTTNTSNVAKNRGKNG